MDFSNIPDSVKVEARDCTTPEEFLALAQREGIELTDEELEGVAGGKFDWCDGFGCGKVCVLKC